MNLLSAPRQPFVGLALAAAAGIIVADVLPYPSFALLIPLAMGALVISVWPSSIANYAFVGVGFFWMHIVHLTNSPGSQLLTRLGPSPDAISVIGTVISEPKVAPNGLASFLLHLESIELAEKHESTNAELLVRWRGHPEFGDELKLFGVVDAIAAPRNPGEFDMRSYLRRRDIHQSLLVRYPEDGLLVRHGGGNPILRAAQKSRRWMQAALCRGLEESPDVQSLTGFTRGSSIHAYSNTIQASWFHVFSPLMQNELRAQYNYTEFNVLPNQLGSVGLDIPGFGNFGNQIFIPNFTIMRRPDVADNFIRIFGHHTVKFGGELRQIRLYTDRQGGITYTFSGINNFLANSLQSTQFLGDLSAPSPFFNNSTGQAFARQAYYIGYAQDEWKIKPNVTLSYGLRYEYYSPLKEANNRQIYFDINTGTLRDSSGDPYHTKKNNFGPRLALTWSPNPKGTGWFGGGKTVLRGGVGIFYGPGQTEDQIQPIESDRVSSTLSNVTNAFPANIAAIVANFIANPNNRSYQPRAYDRAKPGQPAPSPREPSAADLSPDRDVGEPASRPEPRGEEGRAAAPFMHVEGED